MELRLAITLVGILSGTTLVVGVLQGLVFGGLLSQDASLWVCCSWIQGTLGGGVICGVYALFSGLQLLVLVGLILRKRWARFMGLGLGLLYTCSGLLPFGLLLIVLLLRPSVVEAFRPVHQS